jgi:hypothetical protein
LQGKTLNVCELKAAAFITLAVSEGMQLTNLTEEKALQDYTSVIS